MWTCVIVFTVVVVWLVVWFRRRNKIPKHVFTYWYSQDPSSNQLVRECTDTWRLHNADWDIHTLNDDNLKEFTEIHRRSDESVQHFTDRLRLDLLERYGGVWLDATIWMNTSLNWVHSYNENVVGFNNPIRTETNAMENWFIACVPGSRLIREWNREFKKFETHDHLRCVSPELLKRVEQPSYLLQNVAWLVAVHNDPTLLREIRLLESRDTVFGLHWKCNWNPRHFAEVFQSEKHKHYPFIKITQVERLALTKLYADREYVF